jgi:hypothetical protein
VHPEQGQFAGDNAQLTHQPSPNGSRLQIRRALRSFLLHEQRATVVRVTPALSPVARLPATSPLRICRRELSAHVRTSQSNRCPSKTDLP